MECGRKERRYLRLGDQVVISWFRCTGDFIRHAVGVRQVLGKRDCDKCCHSTRTLASTVCVYTSFNAHTIQTHTLTQTHVWDRLHTKMFLIIIAFVSHCHEHIALTAVRTASPRKIFDRERVCHCLGNIFIVVIMKDSIQELFHQHLSETECVQSRQR